MKLNLQNTELKITAGLLEQFPKDDLPQIAVSGRSNVGKSSLVNSLIGRKSLARVSKQPGKTVTINFYGIDGRLYLVDLPGYGYAKRSDEERRKWSSLVDGYLRDAAERKKIKLVIQLVDMKTGPADDDLTMLNWLNAVNIPYIIVATKSDKLNKTDRAASLDSLKTLGADVIPFSSLSGEGKNELINEIIKYIRGE